MSEKRAPRTQHAQESEMEEVRLAAVVGQHWPPRRLAVPRHIGEPEP